MLSDIEIKMIASELFRLQRDEAERIKDIPDYLTQNQAAKYKGCTRKRISDWIESGELKTFPRGNRKMIKTYDLDKLLNRPIVKICG